MRVEVDLTRCQGYGNCLGAAPEIFDLNDDGLVLILRQPEAGDEDATRAGAKLCPVKAITVIEDDQT
jgi:ferredoxin